MVYWPKFPTEEDAEGCLLSAIVCGARSIHVYRSDGHAKGGLGFLYAKMARKRAECALSDLHAPAVDSGGRLCHALRFFAGRTPNGARSLLILCVSHDLRERK